MHLLSCVAQRRQEVYYGYLLSSPDVAPVSGLCPLLHGPQLCLLPELYRKEEIKLLNEGSQRFDTPERSKSVGSSNAADAVGIAGAALIAIPLSLISLGMHSHAAEVRRNFAMKELQQAMVSPGDTKSGFVYFQLPKLANSPDRWRLQIQAVDPKNKATLTYSYVLDWKRRS